MKSVRLSGLAASTALALILALSSQPGQAQSASDGQAQVATPIPDTMAKPADKPATEALPSETATAKPEIKHTAEEPAKAAEAPATDATPKPDTTAAIKPETKAETKTDTAREPAVTASVPDAASPADAENAATKDETGTTAKPTEATQQAAVAPEATPPATVDTAVVDALKDVIANRLDRYVPRKDARAGVEAFYKARDYKPLWVANGAADVRAKAAIAYLATVKAVGLDPNDYPTPNFDSASTPGDLAAAELQLANAVLIYAHEAQVGRIHYTRVGSDISFDLKEPDPAAVLAKLADTQDVAAALDGYNPPHAGFKALKAKLADLLKGGQAAPAEEKKKVVRVSSGRILRPGMRDPRVMQLRKRLDVAGDKNNPLYDDAVLEAVKAFQTEANIGVDGMAGPNTVAALNGEIGPSAKPRDPIETVIVNMERWRWLPRKLGNTQDTYVVVNVPDYSLSLMHDGKTYWKTKIVVGKPANKTPMISADMKFITVNPTWNVPPSIIENEYLPALEQDPTVLERYGLQIKQEADGTVRIWQPPGAANALGRIRFNFPNKFLVYQHDTPDKYLFARASRAYSHGCMRVENPIEYATKLLSLELPNERYTPARIQSMFGNNEININFPRPIPVHLTYQTAFVDQDGKLQFRDDVYGRDARMIAILKNKGALRVAHIPVNHPPDTSAKPVRMPVGMFPGSEGPGYRGPGLFEFLFGARAEQPRTQYYRGRNFIGPRAQNGGAYTRR